MPGPYCTAADVKGFAPEFAILDDVAFDTYIARASRELNPRVWGQRITDAAVLLVAHYMTLFPPAGMPASTDAEPAGPVASKTVGSVSVTYAVSGATAPPVRDAAGSLGLTDYGTEYARLVRQVCAGGFLLG